MFYSILFYSILFYSILFYSILFYSILFYSILFYSILFYSILFYSILFYSILFYSILFYSILFYSILFYSILFYSILFYSILFYFILFFSFLFFSFLFFSFLFFSFLLPSVTVVSLMKTSDLSALPLVGPDTLIKTIAGRSPLLQVYYCFDLFISLFLYLFLYLFLFLIFFFFLEPPKKKPKVSIILRCGTCAGDLDSDYLCMVCPNGLLFPSLNFFYFPFSSPSYNFFSSTPRTNSMPNLLQIFGTLSNTKQSSKWFPKLFFFFH